MRCSTWTQNKFIGQLNTSISSVFAENKRFVTPTYVSVNCRLNQLVWPLNRNSCTRVTVLALNSHLRLDRPR